VLWASVAATASAALATLLKPGALEYLPDVQTPLGLEQAGSALSLIARVALVVLSRPC